MTLLSKSLCICAIFACLPWQLSRQDCNACAGLLSRCSDQADVQTKQQNHHVAACRCSNGATISWSSAYMAVGLAQVCKCHPCSSQRDLLDQLYALVSYVTVEAAIGAWKLAAGHDSVVLQSILCSPTLCTHHTPDSCASRALTAPVSCATVT